MSGCCWLGVGKKLYDRTAEDFEAPVLFLASFFEDQSRRILKSMEWTILTRALNQLGSLVLSRFLKRRQRRERFQQLKRQLHAARQVRALSAGLVRLRSLLLEDRKTFARTGNRVFFEKWCQQPFVELGSVPGEEFWNRTKCAEFLGDLDAVRI